MTTLRRRASTTTNTARAAHMATLRRRVSTTTNTARTAHMTMDMLMVPDVLVMTMVLVAVAMLRCW